MQEYKITLAKFIRRANVIKLWNEMMLHNQIKSELSMN
jgi:hypothetical protein